MNHRRAGILGIDWPNRGIGPVLDLRGRYQVDVHDVDDEWVCRLDLETPMTSTDGMELDKLFRAGKPLRAIAKLAWIRHKQGLRLQLPMLTAALLDMLMSGRSKRGTAEAAPVPRPQLPHIRAEIITDHGKAPTYKRAVRFVLDWDLGSTTGNMSPSEVVADLLHGPPSDKRQRIMDAFLDASA